MLIRTMLRGNFSFHIWVGLLLKNIMMLLRLKNNYTLTIYLRVGLYHFRRSWIFGSHSLCVLFSPGVYARNGAKTSGMVIGWQEVSDTYLCYMRHVASTQPLTILGTTTMMRACGLLKSHLSLSSQLGKAGITGTISIPSTSPSQSLA